MARHQRGDPLGLGGLNVDGVIHRQRPVDDTALDLASLGHLRKDCGIDGRGNLRVDHFHGGEDADLRLVDAESLRYVNSALHDVDLGGEVGGDVDGGVGHDQHVIEPGDIHDEDVAQAAVGAQAAVAFDDVTEELVGGARNPS